MLVLWGSVYHEIVAGCLDAWPLEACGLIAGPGTGNGAPMPGPEGRRHPAPGGDGSADTAVVCYPAINTARSSRVYTVAPQDLLRADRHAEDAGMEILGVWHSHTHTDAWPSPTDVAQAPDPQWHYVVVSLRDVHPVVRSYRITDGRIEEEPLALQ